MCLEMGREVMATVVDHKKPHHGDEELFWDHDNWQSLCAACHSGAKRVKENRGYLPGCDIYGVPLDNDHFWNKRQ